jgi:hypothetical protein
MLLQCVATSGQDISAYPAKKYVTWKKNLATAIEEKNLLLKKHNSMLSIVTHWMSYRKLILKKPLLELRKED